MCSCAHTAPPPSGVTNSPTQRCVPAILAARRQPVRGRKLGRDEPPKTVQRRGAGKHESRTQDLAPKVAELELYLEQARRELRLRETALKTRERELRDASHLLERRQRELAEARASEDELGARAAKAEGRAEALAAEVDDGKVALERLKGQLSLGQEEMGTLRAQLADAGSDVSFLRSRLQSRETELAAENQRQVDLESALCEAARSAGEDRSQIARVQRLLGEARDGREARELELSAMRVEIAHARSALKDARAAIDRERSENQALEQVLLDTTLALHGIGTHLDRIEQSSSWRFGHGLFRWMRILSFRKPLGQGAVAAAQLEVRGAITSAEQAQRPRTPRTRAGGTAPPSVNSEEDPAGESVAQVDEESRRDLAARVRERIGAPPEIADPPLVSILVVNRNGRVHLERLLEALKDRTDYPRFDLYVVDNASTDGSVELLDEAYPPFPLTVLRNDHNANFSEAANQAAEHAGGELLLLLDCDVEPVEAGWLNELVACHRRAGGGAVGALVVHADPHRATSSGWEIQHGGVRFRREGGTLRGFSEGAGEDPLHGVLRPDRPCPAVNAACLLVGVESFQSAGGLHPGYTYGSEDIDFCLTLQERGEPVFCCSRAVLLQAEPSTKTPAGREVSRSNRMMNTRLFHERWGPRLWRQANLDRMGGDGFWAPDMAPRLVIARTSDDSDAGFGDGYTAEELGDALTREGFAVEYLERTQWHSIGTDADYVLALLDAYDPALAPVSATKIAWIGTGPSGGSTGTISPTTTFSWPRPRPRRPRRTAHRTASGAVPTGHESGALQAGPHRVRGPVRLCLRRQPLGRPATDRAGALRPGR